MTGSSRIKQVCRLTRWTLSWRKLAPVVTGSFFSWNHRRVLLGGLLLFGAMSSVLSAQHATSTSATPTRSTLLVQTLYLWRGGCQPQTMNAKAGTFVLSVINLSSENNLQLILHPAGTAVSTTSAIGAQALTATSTRWNSTVTLTPGTYLIEATNSSTHHCSIVVQ